MSGARASALAMILAAALTSLAHAAEWFDAYEQGEAAQKKGQSREAIAHFQEAIRKKPTSGFNVKAYGMRYVKEYLPHYRLGRALCEINSMEQAQTALRAEQKLGFVQESSARADFERL